MIIIEASSDFHLFETFSVRIKTTSLAIHEKMRPEVLDDIDEIIVELRLVISNWFVVMIDVVINVWCKLLSSFSAPVSAPVSKIPKHQ